MSSRAARLVSLLFLACPLVACGGPASRPGDDVDIDAQVESEAGVDAGGDRSDASEASTTIAESGPRHPATPPPDPPQVVNSGGPHLAAPHVVPIFFASDDAGMTASIADFVARVGQSDYWKAATAEYGVGPATSAAPVHRPAADDPPMQIDDAAIRAWLSGLLDAGDPSLGTPDDDTVYALFYPAGVTITYGGAATPTVADAGADAMAPDGASEGGPTPAVATSCVDFAGYHDTAPLDSAHGSRGVPFAVIPRCPTFHGVTGLDVVTGVASHELIESATDPLSTTDPAYLQVDTGHIYWGLALGGGTEVGDMCSQDPAALTTFPGLPYVVQRSWSNLAETAGHDPCVPPLPGDVYFNTAPELDTVAMSFGGAPLDVKGVAILAGQSKTVRLALFSDGPTWGPWTVSAMDTVALQGGMPRLAFSFDHTTGTDGDVIQMTIQVLAVESTRREIFVVQSTLGGKTHGWFGVVAS